MNTTITCSRPMGCLLKVARTTYSEFARNTTIISAANATPPRECRRYRAHQSKHNRSSCRHGQQVENRILGAWPRGSLHGLGEASVQRDETPPNQKQDSAPMKIVPQHNNEVPKILLQKPWSPGFRRHPGERQISERRPYREIHASQ